MRILNLETQVAVSLLEQHAALKAQPATLITNRQGCNKVGVEQATDVCAGQGEGVEEVRELAWGLSLIHI